MAVERSGVNASRWASRNMDDAGTSIFQWRKRDGGPSRSGYNSCPCDRKERCRSVRRDPGAGIALGAGDLFVRHLLGDLAAKRDRIAPALERRQVEPLMRSDEVDQAGAAARPIKSALEQQIRDRGRRNR